MRFGHFMLSFGMKHFGYQRQYHGKTSKMLMMISTIPLCLTYNMLYTVVWFYSLSGSCTKGEFQQCQWIISPGYFAHCHVWRLEKRVYCLERKMVRVYDAFELCAHENWILKRWPVLIRRRPFLSLCTVHWPHHTCDSQWWSWSHLYLSMTILLMVSIMLMNKITRSNSEQII